MAMGWRLCGETRPRLAAKAVPPPVPLRFWRGPPTTKATDRGVVPVSVRCIRKVLAFRSAIPSRADLAAAGWARARASPLLPSGRYGFKAVSGRGSLGGTRLKRQGQVELGSHSLIASDGTGAQ